MAIEYKHNHSTWCHTYSGNCLGCAAVWARSPFCTRKHAFRTWLPQRESTKSSNISVYTKWQKISQFLKFVARQMPHYCLTHDDTVRDSTISSILCVFVILTQYFNLWRFRRSLARWRQQFTQQIQVMKILARICFWNSNRKLCYNKTNVWMQTLILMKYGGQKAAQTHKLRAQAKRQYSSYFYTCYRMTKAC